MNGKLKIKRSVSLIISAAVVFCTAATAADGRIFADDSSQYQEKLNEIAQKQEELADKIADMQGDIQKEKEQNALIESQIATTTEKIDLINGYLSDLASSISQLEEKVSVASAQVNEKKRDIESGIADFKQRLRALYLAGNDSYTSVILGSGDFFDMLMKVELVHRVADHDNKMLDTLVEKKNALEEQTNKLNKQKKELSSKQEDYEAQKKAMSEEMERLNELYTKSKENLKQLESEKNKYVSQKSEYDAEQDAFERQLQAAIKANAAKITTATTTTTTTTTSKKTTTTKHQDGKKPQSTTKSTSQKTTTSRTTTTTTGASTSQKFIWPCPVYYLITSDFGSRWGSFHYGMDIGDGGIRGANVVASRGGTVIMSNNTCNHDYGKEESCGCGWGWGNYCVIDHGDGYQTIYAHMSECKVETGQTVSQGQCLGNVGSTGWSTGEHLHFEVRVDGTAIDPMDFFK